MRYLRLITLSALLILGVATAGMAQGNLVRKVDSFDFLADYSGSMMMQSNNVPDAAKMDLAKDVLSKINSTIPPLGYIGSMHTFAPAGTVVPVAPWQADAMGQAIGTLRSDLPIFGRMTPMGDGLAELASQYSAMARPTAVILVSDGASNTGVDPVAEAAAIYNAQPGLCIHVVSLADTPEGAATLNKIAEMNDCAVAVQAETLLTDQAALDKFVADVFYNTAIEEAIVLRGVNFAFDSFQLDGQAQSILNEVAVILRANPDAKVLLEGWTDHIGTDAYNKVLSQRRADAVRDYLVKQGVPGFNMRTMGMGKSFKFDNQTEEGRYLNRRTELIFE